MRRVAGVLLSVVVGWPAAARDVTDTIGAELYLEYCATCHGAAAAGDGPMTDFLVRPVPDLTGLAARNAGVFPMTAVLDMIDGRERRPGHGGAMPVFRGLFGRELSGLGDERIRGLIVQGRILSLARYLEGIQDGEGVRPGFR